MCHFSISWGHPHSIRCALLYTNRMSYLCVNRNEYHNTEVYYNEKYMYHDLKLIAEIYCFISGFNISRKNCLYNMIDIWHVVPNGTSSLVHAEEYIFPSFTKGNGLHVISVKKKNRRHETSYKQLEVKTNRMSYLCVNRNEYHNTEVYYNEKYMYHDLKL
jgi:hypothetical protein